jgi:ribosome maturation factor RimP
MEQQIDKIIRASIEHQGLRLVRVKMMDASGRKVLQIMIERSDGKNVNVDECAEVSHLVSALLDVEDPIPYEYHLEVTSPGIDRPLVSAEDFTRFAGFEAKIETMLMIEGRKRWRGIVNGMEGDNILITVDGVLHRVPIARISTAKLILNDALLDAYKEGRITH